MCVYHNSEAFHISGQISYQISSRVRSRSRSLLWGNLSWIHTHTHIYTSIYRLFISPTNGRVFPVNTFILIPSLIFSLRLLQACVRTHTRSYTAPCNSVTFYLFSLLSPLCCATLPSLFSFHLPFDLENTCKFLKTQFRPHKRILTRPSEQCKI